MIEAILPGSVTSREAHGRLWTDPLLPAEALALGPVAERRRRDFTAGRNCARAALEELGFAHFPVLIGRRGQPRWPAGVVGSITHCDGYCAAAAAMTAEVTALGIDAERNRPISGAAQRFVSTENERAWCASHREEGTHWPTVIFSAKESLFKAWFPIAGRPIGFNDVDVEIVPAESIFRLRLLVRAPFSLARGDRIKGRFLLTENHILTSLAVPAGR